MKLPEALKVLSIRNFRLYFGGQSISLIGSWITRLATKWLAYDLTHSGFWLGVVSFASEVPTFLISPLAGVWIDRLDRRRVLLVTQIILALHAATFAFLTLSKLISFWHVVALGILQGIINAFDMPARQAFIVEMVEERSNIKSAISMNSTMINMAKVLGPSTAGFIIAFWGFGLCFLIDAFSYIAVIGSLLAMKVKPRQTEITTKSPWAQMKEGWSYVTGFVPVRLLIMIFAIISFVGVPYTVLLPIFAGEILHGGSKTLGILMGAAGVGAIISGIFLTFRKSVLGLYRLLNVSAALFGVALICFALSKTIWLSVLLLGMTGCCQILMFASNNILMQTIIPEDKRGRVMSYRTMAHMGALPLGALLAGGLSHFVGAPATLVICGAGCILSALWFMTQHAKLRSIVRPLYIEMGILPPPGENT